MEMEYKIAHFSKENERAIFKREDDTDRWLCRDNSWSENSKHARRFLHEDTAVSALITIRRGWEIDITSTRKSELGEHKEKELWSELS